MTYKALPDFATALDVAEAVGRLYAPTVGKPWPMPPDRYGPGRQPFPPEAFYQRYYTAPLDAVAADPAMGIPAPLPPRVETDSFVVAQDGRTVRVTGNRDVVLDFRGLTASAVSADAEAKP